MHTQQQGTAADPRESPRSGRDTGAVQYKELLASRDAIDRERQKYFELFQLAPDACFLTDSRGVIHEANAAAARLLDVPAQFLPGKLLPAFFEELARPDFILRLEERAATERFDEWTSTLRARSGALTAVSVSIRRMTGTERSSGAYAWIVRDASSEAQEESRIKTDLLAVLSHEFRTPLQAIFGYTELLEREIHGPLTEAQRRDIQRIQRSEQHLLGLITSILEFGKLDSGQPVEVPLEPTDMHEVLGSMEGLVGAQLEEKDLRYSYKPPGSPVVASANAARVRQILLNLLTNAIKFTDRGGSISLEVGLESDSVAVRVIDAGRGVPADKLEAIFQPFVQLKSRAAVTNGTGLGLTISRRLAAAMGGSLEATSTPGQGSTFTLRLQRVSRSSIRSRPSS